MKKTLTPLLVLAALCVSPSFLGADPAGVPEKELIVRLFHNATNKVEIIRANDFQMVLSTELECFRLWQAEACRSPELSLMFTDQDSNMSAMQGSISLSQNNIVTTAGLECSVAKWGTSCSIKTPQNVSIANQNSTNHKIHQLNVDFANFVSVLFFRQFQLSKLREFSKSAERQWQEGASLAKPLYNISGTLSTMDRLQGWSDFSFFKAGLVRLSSEVRSELSKHSDPQANLVSYIDSLLRDLGELYSSSEPI